MKRSGSADLPLHYGYVPQWLAERMAKLGLAITEVLLSEYGKAEVIRRLSDPFWFQSLGAAFGLVLFGATGWALTYYLRRIYPVQTNIRNSVPDSDTRIDAMTELIGSLESHPKC